jgi:hypothetical protein
MHLHTFASCPREPTARRGGDDDAAFPSRLQNFSLFNIFFRHVFSPPREDIASRVDQVRAKALERLQKVMVELVSKHLGGHARQSRSSGGTGQAEEIARRVGALLQVRLLKLVRRVLNCADVVVLPPYRCTSDIERSRFSDRLQALPSRVRHRVTKPHSPLCCTHCKR